MTKFFEPISVSATHIYHSALELCPISSVTRQLYYDWGHHIDYLPRVVVGIPDSWDSTISFSGKDHYEFCAWSPCGQFVAAQTVQTIEIRNQLTFELLTVLQFANNTHPPTCPPVYSPDGQSLASLVCSFVNVILIWDIQTGGVAKEIRCCRGMDSLVWSLDGRTIATTLHYEGSIPGVKTYDVASGAQLFTGKFNLGANLHLWAWEQKFQFMKIESHSDDHMNKILIYEIGPTLIEIESLSIMRRMQSQSSSPITFSPSTYHASILGDEVLYVIDIRNSDCLLEEMGCFTSSQFSSNGSLFAASNQDGIRVWKYTSGTYILWGKSLFQHLQFWDNPSLQLSPTSSSILCQSGNVLQLWHFHDPPTTPKTCNEHIAVSQSYNRIVIATANKLESTVAITNLHSQTPHQFIDTGMEIEGLAITGQVLLVAGSETVMAWLLTPEGLVCDVSLSYNNRAGQKNSIWTMPLPLSSCKLVSYRVEGQFGIIGGSCISPLVYNTGNGIVLEPMYDSLVGNSSLVANKPWIPLHKPFHYQEYYPLHPYGLPQHNTPSEVGWLIPNATTQEAGWVMDPRGRHRFWVPVEWRKSWNCDDWHHNTTTLVSSIVGQPVVIKF